MELTHVIDEASPLAAWLQGEEGRAADADSEVVVMVSEGLQVCMSWLLGGGVDWNPAA